MDSKQKLVAQNSCTAKRTWGSRLNRGAIQILRTLTQRYGFSIDAGDLKFFDSGWYVTHTGLIRLANRRRCSGIEVHPIPEFSDVLNRRFAFKATVYKTRQSPGFSGYGDAEPCNVSTGVRGAEMRIAETRAVNRALRKAYGIGLCSVEEIGATPPNNEKLPPQNTTGYSAGPKVRDRLCQVIRQHQLDPELVKAYAVDYCGTKTLREASREQVENFVQELADWAVKDRNALLCQLNSYMRPAKEVVA